MAARQVARLQENASRFDIPFLPMVDPRHGIVHIIGPELGFTLPGITLVCGDSHTSTHGAFGALAFGIGTSECECVFATQTLKQSKLKNRCIIAPSFGEIFYSNCFKNGILPIVADGVAHEQISQQAKTGKEICVDLLNQEISVEGLDAIKFVVPEDRRQALLHGRDEISPILHDHEDSITAFEKQHQTSSPWLFAIVPV